MPVRNINFRSQTPRAYNPTAMTLGAGKQLSSAFDDLATLGNSMNQKRIEGEMTSVVGKYAGQDITDKATQELMMGEMAGVQGATIKDVKAASDMLFGRSDADRAYNKGQYGFQTDEMGNAYSYNKNTGEYTQVGESPYKNGINPKNVTLKSVTSRDAGGVETTVQVPYNKVTGQPVDTDNYDFSGADAGYENAQGVRVDNNGNQLAVQPNAGNATQNPPITVNAGNVGTGVKHPKKLDNTIQLPTGETVYVDAQGKPYQNNNGQYLVKSQGTENVKRVGAKRDMMNTLGSLDQILTRVQTDPESVGSIGSDFGNWIGNQVNDILKVPTGTRLNRNQIEATGGVIAAGLRKGVESGVMTEQDFIRYSKLVPNKDDSPQEATYKGQQLMNTLSNQFGVVPAGYKKQYNTQTGEYRIVREK